LTIVERLDTTLQVHNYIRAVCRIDVQMTWIPHAHRKLK